MEAHHLFFLFGSLSEHRFLFFSFTVVVITSGGDAGVILFPGLGRQMQLVVSIDARVAF
jgi:hypothetical protein